MICWPFKANITEKLEMTLVFLSSNKMGCKHMVSNGCGLENEPISGSIAWREIFFGNPLNYRSDGVSETWNSGPRVPGIERPEISFFWMADFLITSFAQGAFVVKNACFIINSSNILMKFCLFRVEKAPETFQWCYYAAIFIVCCIM